MNRRNESARRQPGAGSSLGTRGRAQRDSSATFGRMPRGRFHRDWLPDPATFYSRALDQLGRPNANGWAMARCPFHDDAHASLSVNLRRDGGHFRCHACGAHGPGIVAFIAQRDGLDFEHACRALGAWEMRP